MVVSTLVKPSCELFLLLPPIELSTVYIQILEDCEFHKFNFLTFSRFDFHECLAKSLINAKPSH